MQQKDGRGAERAPDGELAVQLAHALDDAPETGTVRGAILQVRVAPEHQSMASAQPRAPGLPGDAGRAVRAALGAELARFRVKRVRCA